MSTEKESGMLTRTEFEDLNLQLIAARKAIIERDRILDLMASMDAELKQLKTDLPILEVQRRHEQMDVAELENTGVASLFFTVLGKRDAVLEQQVQEFLEAKLAHERCHRRIEAIETHLQAMETQLVELADCEETLAALQQQQLAVVKALPAPEADELRAGEILQAQHEQMLAEVEEAQSYGRAAHTAVAKVLKQLHRLSLRSNRWHDTLEALIKDSIAAQNALETFEDELQDAQLDFWQNQNPDERELADSPFSFLYLAARLLKTHDNAQRIKLWQHHMARLNAYIKRLNGELYDRAAQLQADIEKGQQQQAALIDALWQPHHFAEDDVDGR